MLADQVHDRPAGLALRHISKLQPGELPRRNPHPRGFSVSCLTSSLRIAQSFAEPIGFNSRNHLVAKRPVVSNLLVWRRSGRRKEFATEASNSIDELTGVLEGSLRLTQESVQWVITVAIV